MKTIRFQMRNELFVRLDECGHEYGCLGAGGDGEILEEWRMERPGKSREQQTNDASDRV